MRQFATFKPSNEIFSFGDHSETELIACLARVEAEIEHRGGLHVYQLASTVGQDSKRGGDSLRKLLQWFNEMKVSAKDTLEIGSLSPDNAILNKVFGTVTRIDLNSQNPKILQQDFMERPLPLNDSERFDLISCSLVLNFVPSALRRGEMLVRMTHFLREPDSSSSRVFLVLPLPCVSNSRYFDGTLMDKVVTSLGFEILKYHEAKKVAYWLLEWRGSAAMRRIRTSKKELKGGANRNNFFIDMTNVW